MKRLVVLLVSTMFLVSCGANEALKTAEKIQKEATKQAEEASKEAAEAVDTDKEVNLTGETYKVAYLKTLNGENTYCVAYEIKGDVKGIETMKKTIAAMGDKVDSCPAGGKVTTSNTNQFGVDFKTTNHTYFQ